MVEVNFYIFLNKDVLEYFVIFTFSSEKVLDLCKILSTRFSSNLHFFKSRSSDIVLLKQGNLHQNAKRYEARNTERDDQLVARRRRAHPCERSDLRAMRMCVRSEEIFYLNIL